MSDVKNEKINEKPTDFYKRRAAYLRKRYSHLFTAENWAGGEIDTGDGVVLEEYDVMRRPGEFLRVYALYYEGRLIAVYDDDTVAEEVARIAHLVLSLARRRRSRR